MVKIKDILGTECEEQDSMIIMNALDDPVKVCQSNRDKYFKMFNELDSGMTALDNADELSSMLAVLNNFELDRLYSHPILKEFDLLP